MIHKELERWYRLRKLKKASQILIVVAVVLAISAYAVSSIYKRSPEPFEPPKDPKSASSMQNFTYSAPGAHPWELKASDAVMSDALDKIELTDPKVVYQGGKGGTIRLSAKSGQLNRKSSNVSALGDVVLQYKDMKFTTGEISYSQEKQVAETSSSVSVEGNDLRLTGKGLKVSIDNEEITIERDVKAKLFNVRLVGPGSRLPM
jgi:LPS export ABC transporter protein LptC